jgi:pimeloyl-ACP methyl ester carboxylesterase
VAAADSERYSYAEYCGYLFALWDQLGLGDKVIMVLHDWGSAMGLDWANRNRSRVQGLVYMEAIVTPLTLRVLRAMEINGNQSEGPPAPSQPHKALLLLGFAAALQHFELCVLTVTGPSSCGSRDRN